MQLSLLLALLGVNSALAHMEMTDPPPLRSEDNPNSGGNVDSELKSPIKLSQYPCKNTLDLLGTEQGAPVAEYKAGESYSATIEGGAAHEGGSCQFSLSYDKGESFQVIQSIVGGCPVSGGASFDFTIPADAPNSDAAIFSWSWINKIGNREFYQNCAVVSISGGQDSEGGKRRRQDGSVAFKDRPEMFVANIIDGCSTAEGTDVLFPDPGPDVLMNTEGTPPEGPNCGAPVQGGGGSSGGGSGGGAGGDTGSGGGQGGGDDGQYHPPEGGASGDAGGDTGSGGGQGGGDDGQYHPPEGSDAGSGSGEGAPAQSSAVGGGPAQSSAAGNAPSASSATEEPARTDPAESGPASGGNAPEPTSGSDAPEPSITGGIFVTAPIGGSAAPTGSAPTGGHTPTTLETSVAVPSSTGAPDEGDSTGGGEGAKSGGCSEEENGMFNCVGGNQFQQCASGQWTEPRPMAAGTSCAPGMSQDLAAARKKLRFRRY
ncbi:hypothetical protein VUR80DRAFT_5754 [Thermomyces stellatus]